jgi:pimeloyl-ACP methyl ester carboxylesterase
MLEIVRQQALTEGMLNQPAVLLGLSLGGMVAWQWLSQYPEDVSAAVLINSSFANLSPFYRRLRWQAYSHMARIIAAQSDAQRESLIVSLVSNQDQPARALTSRRWTELRQQRPMSALNEMRQILAAARFNPGFQPPIQPVLLLNSSGDRLVSPHCSKTIHQNYGVPLITHPTAGHDLPNDDGAWVIRQLQNWQALRQ